MTADTRMGRTGSTSFRGPTSSSSTSPQVTRRCGCAARRGLRRAARCRPRVATVIASSVMTATGRRGQGPAAAPADQPSPRTDANSKLAHTQLLRRRTQGRIDVYFAGDSITRRWGATDYPELLANWKRELLRLECRRLRLGRRPHREHPLAPHQRRTGRRASEGDRAAGRHEQHRHHAVRPAPTMPRSRTSRAASRPSSTRCEAKAPKATIIAEGDFSAQRQHRGDADHQSHQRQSRHAGRRHAGSLSEHQRPAGGWRR